MANETVIRFRCPVCSKTLTAKLEMAGRGSACPACKSTLIVPPPPPPRSQTADEVFGDWLAKTLAAVPPPPMPPDPCKPEAAGGTFKGFSPDSTGHGVGGIAAVNVFGFRNTVLRLVPVTLLVGGLAVWLCTLFSDPLEENPLDWFLAVPIHYGSLAIACWGIGLLVRRRLGGHKTTVTIGTLCLMVATLWLGGKYETFTHHWMAGDRTFYLDTYTRLGLPTLVYREVFNLSGGGSACGPIAGSGKLHGEWTYYGVFHTSGNIIEHRWYWYGKEITEGEWHLRTK